MQQQAEGMLILDLFAAVRREIPGLGTHKLHRLLGSSFCSKWDKDGGGISFCKLLDTHNQLVKRKRL